LRSGDDLKDYNNFIKYFVLPMLIGASLALGACGGDSPTETNEPQSRVITKKGDRIRVDVTPPEIPKRVKLNRPDLEPPSSLPEDLVIQNLSEGAGPIAKSGDELTIEYHAIDDAGKVAYSSWDKTGPFQLHFMLGDGQYFAAFEEGIEGTRLGSRREMLFPARITEKLGLLFYAIDLLEIRRGEKCWMAPSLRPVRPERKARIHERCKSRVRVL
jgi:peptidylprolyl isomerase